MVGFDFLRMTWISDAEIFILVKFYTCKIFEIAEGEGDGADPDLLFIVVCLN